MAEHTGAMPAATFGRTEPLIGGPILRRADRSGVFIWIATCAPVDAAAEIYAAGQESTPIGRAAEVRTQQLGKRLYVHLLHVTPLAGAFPQDALLTYNVWLNGVTLAELGLGPEALAY